MQNQSERQIHELFIQTTAELLWRSLTDGNVTPNYFFGTIVKSSFKKGESIRYELRNGRSSRAARSAR